MKHEPPPLQVGTPCPKRWEDMAGDAKRRFCEHCQLHVHNLSAMTRRERDHFVIKSGGQACIAYELRDDGSMVTPSLWRSLAAPFRRLQFAAIAVLATLLPFLFSACASRRFVGGVAKPEPARSSGECVADLGTITTLGVPMPAEASNGKKSR